MVDKVKMFPVYYELFLVWKVEKRVYKKKKSFDFFFFSILEQNIFHILGKYLYFMSYLRMEKKLKNLISWFCNAGCFTPQSQ